MVGRVDSFKPGIVLPAAFDPRSNLHQPRGIQLREINPAGFSLQEEVANMDPFSQVLTPSVHQVKAIFDNWSKNIKGFQCSKAYPKYGYVKGLGVKPIQDSDLVRLTLLKATRVLHM